MFIVLFTHAHTQTYIYDGGKGEKQREPFRITAELVNTD